MLRSSSSPNMHNDSHLRKMMHQVLIASIPGIIALCYFFGWGVIINISIAAVTAVLTEIVMLKLRHRNWQQEISDSSALVTALLLALAVPPLVPWWITVIGITFAIIFAKHLYGGLGLNPFNPAMAGYVLLLISFPVQMTSWAPASPLWDHSISFMDTFQLIIGGKTSAGVSLIDLINGFDGYTTATPLDTMKHKLSEGYMTSEVLQTPLYSWLAGVGWQWVNIAFLLGGLFLIWKKCIYWQLSAAFLTGLAGMSLLFYLLAGDSYASPLFHLFSGGTMLAAFFIVTDPVTAATSIKGRWIFGIGIGVLVWIIRTWGGYPDAIAFSVLLMNMAAPTIDHYTRPLAFGETESTNNGDGK